MNDPPTAGPPSATGRTASGPALVTGYDILGVLGRGGMGVVYKARQVGLNRLCALKMILAGTHASVEELLRFKIEAEAVAALQHPNIVQVFDISQRDGRPFFSMEFCSGGSLQQKLQAGRMGLREAATMLETLARAVDFAHRHGIVHRDLKPANVLLAQDGTPKITDFGLAKRLTDDQGQTGTEAVLGTPTYMAPEQAQGKTRLVGPPADVYALGAIFYDMLTGEPPFRGDTALDTLHLVQTAEPVSPARRRPEMPRDLETICLKCLQKDPNRRYTTAGELADDLRRYLDGKPILARPTTAAERLWKWARRRPAVAALVVLSFVAPIVVAALSLFYSARLGELNKDLQNSEAELKQSNAQLTTSEAGLKRLTGQLKDENEKVRKARNEAVDAWGTAKKEKENALRQEQEAQANFLQALNAVQELLDLAKTQLRNQPGSEAVRKQLLVRAAKMADHFTQRPGDNLDARLRAARAHRLLGDMRERLGEGRLALGHFEKAIALYDGLLEIPRERWKGDYEAERLDAVLRQWGTLETTDPIQAERVLNAALKRYEAGQGARASEVNRAILLINRALHHQNRGQFVRAAADYGRAEQLLEKQRGLAAQLELARLRINRSALRNAQVPGTADELTAQQRQMLTQARQDAEQAARSLQELREQHPKEAALANDLGRAWSNLGLVLDRLGERRKAGEIYQGAVKLFATLVEQSSRTVDYRHQLALARGNLGLHQLAQRDPAAAEKHITQAREALEDLVKGFPDMALYRLDLVRLYNSQGLALLATGRYDQAAAPLERARAELRRSFRQLPAFQAPWRERQAVYQNIVLLHDYLARQGGERGDRAAAERHIGLLAGARRELAQSPAPREVRNRFDRAAQLLELVLLRADLAGTLRVYAEVLVRRGKHAEAARALAELTALASDNWPGRVDAAAALCRCIELTAKDRTLTAAARVRLSREYGEQALSYLRALEDRPPTGLAERLRSAEFRPLAGVAALQAEWRELIDRVDRAGE